MGKIFLYFDKNDSISESIVLQLLSCINDNKQRNLFFDGWYSSINLIEKLTKLGYLNTTVLRSNSKGLPWKIKLPGYDNAYKNEILIQKYEDKTTIYFATNYSIEKEDLKNLYNLKNRGVDVFDQCLEITSIQRKTKKWYKKIFLFGIGASILNGKIIYEFKTGKKETVIQFKESIVEYIFTLYKRKEKSNVELKSYIPPKFRDALHNIKHIINLKRKCMLCGKRTPYLCSECNIHLHPECFNNYHIKNVYNK